MNDVIASTFSYPELVFIDAQNYRGLQTKCTDLFQIVKEISCCESKKLSTLTFAQLRELNDKLTRTLFGQDVPQALYTGVTLSSAERTYVQDSVMKQLTQADCGISPEGSTQVSYELVPVPQSGCFKLLVVVQDGFFTDITESKEKFQNFVLACLGELHKYRSSLEPLMRLYLSLKFNEGYFDLVKLRLR